MWWWALTHMGDEGIMLGVVIAEGLVMGRFEAGVKGRWWTHDGTLLCSV